MLYSPATTWYSLGFELRGTEETNRSGSGQLQAGGLKEQREDQPDDAVSCSHDVEGIDDGSSTDVGEITLLIRAQLKRNLKGEMTQ